MSNIDDLLQYFKALADGQASKLFDSKQDSIGIPLSDLLSQDDMGGSVPINPTDGADANSTRAGVANAPLPDEGAYATEPSTPQPPEQVSDPAVPSIPTPDSTQITIEQTLIPPSLTSDVASVSVDIIIPGDEERYEINWITV